jgi:hypothetical protein
MQMCDKNSADFAEVITRLHDAARHAIAGVDKIGRAVYHQKI